MKRLIFSVSMLLSVSNAFSQWVTKAVDNGLDNPYKIAYCDSKETSTFYAKLEKTTLGMGFYVSGGYFCDDYSYVDISFLIGAEWKRYRYLGKKSTSSETLFILDDITTTDCFEDFKKASSMIMRINDDTCGADIYRFTMTNSTSAYNFVFNQVK
jgi:hypothetical protein